MEIPNHLHDLAAEVLGAEALAAQRSALWAIQLGLIPVKDGDKWCVLYGPNLQEGIAAFGDTPERAMWRFDEAMTSRNGSKA